MPKSNSSKAEKTNVMRILEKKNILYTSYFYDSDGQVDGFSVAEKLRQNPNQVFKTLVTRGAKGFYVFVIPVAKELNLKKAAKAVSEKSVELLHVTELFPLTGYVRGGCSPIGMKKTFPTVIDSSALLLSSIIFSAGRIGAQVEIPPQKLKQLTQCSFHEITV